MFNPAQRTPFRIDGASIRPPCPPGQSGRGMSNIVAGEISK
jgi:hypothetical protein